MAMLGKFTDATELASEVVRKETNADAIFVLALCHYYQDNMEKALKLLAEVLRLAPDHQKSMETYKVSRHSSGFLFLPEICPFDCLKSVH